MDSLNNQYGFDATFVDKPPALYRCIVCQLVLRNPMLILKCGHRFCTPCLDRYKDYSVQMRTELRCPVDRDLIDLTRVCEDHGLRRAVGCLVVKCGEWERGCSWHGELSELEQHEKICEHRPSPITTSSSQDLKHLISSMQVLRGSLESLEHKFEQKEKEIGHLNLKVRELEEGCSNKFKEMEFLKEKNEKIETEVVMLRDRNEKLVKEVDVLNKKNVMFEQELNEMKVKYEEKSTITGENDILRKEIDLLKEGQANELKGIKQNYDEKFKFLEEQFLQMNNNTGGIELRAENLQIANRVSLTPHKLKRILLKPLIGKLHIHQDNHVNFSDNGCDWATVVASDGVVPVGEKGYYEVTFVSGVGTCRTDWATDKFLNSTQKEGVGYCPNSYGFNAKYQVKIHNSRTTYSWGVKVVPGKGSVLGVAIDMERGEILYGVDGNWKAPMGIAFDNISRDIPYFPAISGVGIEVVVNFGEAGFKFGPPHHSFKKLVDL